ncbi:DUF309 domain-containing protein [Caldivirga maquilingensis]|uniref:DUF309 domain-containing protein n=1 Tax=Caldivirga maquilingensis (strain ATCC 700844 / DSM 13496 / JCM 10307 / IC-167) TaxID=397948 RepID=A8MCS5_CALMQ|nr:DUF309 domain-containing protein [Caldivirga maquilingensis]ABW01581.1 protein of unknown function DUF309 [Caldivirga maquilingensis IC-167]
MRILIHALNSRGYEPKDRVKLMGLLRSLGLSIINVRVASNHIEVDANANNIDELPPVVGRVIGPILGVVNLSTGNEVSNPFKSFVDLFNEERFWEAHEVLEPTWRVNRDINIQGLIVAAAAFVKIQENYIDSFLKLAKRALGMIMVNQVDCIDALSFREGLRASLSTLKPFKARCIT